MLGNLSKKKGATLQESDFLRISESLEGRLYNPDNKEELGYITKEKLSEWDNKVDGVSGMGLSENSFTDSDKQKLDTADAHARDEDIHITSSERAEWGRTTYERVCEAGFSGGEEAFYKTLSEADIAHNLALYNEINVTPTDESCFVFEPSTGTVLGLNIESEEALLKLNATDELIIPPTIGGVLVQTIGDGARSILTVDIHPKIRIANSVSSIARNAFSGSQKLVSINIPTSLESIGESAFSGCSCLKEVITPIKPNWEISIGESAFYGTGALTNIDSIIDGIREIPKKAFYGCDGLRTVNIPESVDSVGLEAFGKCDNMVVITVSNPLCNLAQNFCENNVILRGFSGATAWIYSTANENPFCAIDSVYIDSSEVAM